MYVCARARACVCKNSDVSVRDTHVSITLVLVLGHFSSCTLEMHTNAYLELYYSVKRDLLQCQKRPTVSKETYSVKRDLLQCQKRPTTVSKETYYSVKRDLQQRPATRKERGGKGADAHASVYYIQDDARASV